MPYQDRRPVHLANVVVPRKRNCTPGDKLHTPIPCTPIPFESAPLVMTPDTPAFNLELDDEPKYSMAVSQPWTALEDAMIASYLHHPPRPLRTAYPPNSLPPPAALDELTTQLTSSPNWTSERSWQSTRSRFLDIAQKTAAAFYNGSRKRQSSENPRVSARELFVTPIGAGELDITPGGMDLTPGAAHMDVTPMVPRAELPREVPPIEPRPIRPKLRVLGGAKMSRQQHSMDSLYGDAEVGTMSEAWRLSNTLQDRAQSELGADDMANRQSLSSPLTFTFSFNAPKSPRKTAFASSLPNSAVRPLSLLNRGRSFTSHELPSIPSTIDEVSNLYIADPPSPPAHSSSEETSPIHVRPEMLRSVSSPVSSFTTSPPSSISSATSSASLSVLEDQVETEEPEPFTPLNQIFPNSLGLREPPPIISRSPSSSGTTTPAARQASTPAITLTKDSPELGGGSTPTLIAPALPPTGSGSGSGSSGCIRKEYPTPDKEMACMSISPPLPAPRDTTRLVPRPAILSRSFSEGMHPPPTIPLHRSVLHATALGTRGVGRGCMALAPTAKRQKANSNGLSVFVPRPNGQWADELKSPFEHKAVLESGMNVEDE